MKQARRRTEIYHRARPAERTTQAGKDEHEEALKAAYIEFMGKLMPRMSVGSLNRLVDIALEDIPS